MINHQSTLTYITFALLAIAMCAVWLKPIKITDGTAFPPWIGLFVASIAAGMIAGVLQPLSIAGLGIFCGAAYLTNASKKRMLRIFFGILTAILALALALHRLPAFNNPVVISALRLSPDAIDFTQYANFDKGSVGLILLAFMCKRESTLPGLCTVFKRSFPIVLVCTIVVLGIALSTGYVRPNLKIMQVTIIFLLTHLFFTVIAEETFFRGYLQDRLGASLTGFRYGKLTTILCSGLLFGAAHIAGGATYTLLATIAGIAYAYVYMVTERIEAPVMVHFTLNMIHFIGFTYPHVR